MKFEGSFERARHAVSSYGYAEGVEFHSPASRSARWGQATPSPYTPKGFDTWKVLARLNGTYETLKNAMGL